MSETCIFCRIVRGEIPAEIVYEDESCVAFKDIHPQAPVHAIVIPKRHYETLYDVPSSAEHGAIGAAICAAAKALGVAESGFRAVVNNGPDGGQEVPHVHYHVLGARYLGWPPG